MEIERKFLVGGDGWRRDAEGSEMIRQGYLTRNGQASVRVRVKDGRRAWITVKSRDPGRSRAEFEYPIPLNDARAMLALCGDDIVEKHRHKVKRDGVVWEIDVFAGRHAGLVMAEVELEREDQPLSLPDWIGREVTDDPRYRNGALARERHGALAPASLKP